MPPSTRPATPGPSDASKSSKRTMPDAESAPHDSKKPRRNSSAEPSIRRDSNRDAKRRKKRRKKAPVVSLAPKDEAVQRRQDERSRAPLSTRNEIIRFASAEADPTGLTSAAKYSSQAPSSSKTPIQSRQGSSQTLDGPNEHPDQDMPSTQNDKQRAVSTAKSLPEQSLEERIVRLESELKSKNNLIASHQTLLNQVQQAVTCQVCLDLMYKAYALAPCGHLACHSCLVNWFTAPPPDNHPAPPAIRRRKTCPHCRAVVRERPVEVWGVKGIARAVGKSGLLPNQLPAPAETPDSLDANADPWKDIFPKAGTAGHHGFPWFFPDADIDDDDIHIADIAPRGEDVGMLDLEDGGIYRCLDCMHEIWDGVCSNCGRVYPGHRPEGDEEEADVMGWLEEPLVVEEVNMADDPGWMGLEDGDADDDGDFDDWRPFAPWRRQTRTFRGPLGFFDTIHVDEEEDEEDMYGSLDGLRDVEEGEGSGDEGYESSFIDDNDEEAGTVGVESGVRIYEISDNEDEDHDSDQHSRIVDLDSDGGGEQQGCLDVPGPEPRRAGRTHVPVTAVTSDDDIAPLRYGRRWRPASPFVGSDGSDAYWSDE